MVFKMRCLTLCLKNVARRLLRLWDFQVSYRVGARFSLDLLKEYLFTLKVQN